MNPNVQGPTPIPKRNPKINDDRCVFEFIFFIKDKLRKSRFITLRNTNPKKMKTKEKKQLKEQPRKALIRNGAKKCLKV